ncbi:hypothetical protein HT031_006770 [Scenedesmus sp. PABB004]|nr:hypothetical protein HT031_006770 [Scenedesmus sp. PABB004]
MAALLHSSSLRQSIRRGSVVVVLVANNHATRLAVRMARALLRPRDELQLVTVAMTPEGVVGGEALLAPHAAEPCANTVTPVVLVKGDARLADVVRQHAAAVMADLVVVGSHNLCAAGTRGDPLPAAGSFALRLAKSLRCCPVLVVKANSRGPFLGGASAGGLKVMLDCQSNSRHVLGWLMDQLDAQRDSIYLAVTAATAPSGALKETAARMLTQFGVATSVNEFYTAQRVFRDPAATALPQAVEAEAIDILALTAPECKLLPDAITDLLAATRASVLLWRSKQQEAPRGAGAALCPLGSLSLNARRPAGEADAGPAS